MLHCAGTEDERNLRDVQTYLELYAGGGMPDTVCLVAALAPKLQAEEEDTRDPPGNVLPSLATTAAVVVVAAIPFSRSGDLRLCCRTSCSSLLSFLFTVGATGAAVAAAAVAAAAAKSILFSSDWTFDFAWTKKLKHQGIEIGSY